MRRLIHIPIIHTAAELGSLAEAVRAHYARVCGRAGWSRREQAVKALWSDIRKKLDALKFDGPKARIYQDGLPVCGFEERIVRELAQAGSANHQLILRLLEQGAILMGTEAPQLLIEEYDLQKRDLEPRKNVGGTRRVPAADTECAGKVAQADRLLQARDAFIADRIAATLREGEVGLLFLGALHRLDALGATDIRVEPLGGVPSPSGEGRWALREAVGWPRTQGRALRFPARLAERL
jgi:hypothetical protein